MEAENVPTGCYKCGEPGHWSTDCPNEPGARSPAADAGPGHDARGMPSMARQSYAPSQARAAPHTGASAFASPGSRPVASHTGGGGVRKGSWPSAQEQGPPVTHSQSKHGEEAPAVDGDAPGDVGDGGPPAAVGAKAVTQRRRKLTPEMLLDPTDGLPFLLGDMAHQLLPCIKGGRGNELRDVRNLLEGYTRWQKRVFPSVTLVEFLEKVEKLGTSRHLKVSLRDLLYRSSGDEEQPNDNQPQQPQSQRGEGVEEEVDAGAWGGEAWGRSGHAEGDDTGPPNGSRGATSPTPRTASVGHGHPGASATDGPFSARPGFQVGGDRDDDDAGGQQWWDPEAEAGATWAGGEAPDGGAGETAWGPEARPESARTTAEREKSPEGGATGGEREYNWGQGWGTRSHSAEGGSADDPDSMMPAPGLRRRHKGPAASAGTGAGARSTGPEGGSPTDGHRAEEPEGVQYQQQQQQGTAQGSEEEGLGLEDVLEGDAAGSVGAAPVAAGASHAGVKRRRIARMVLEVDDDDDDLGQ